VPDGFAVAAAARRRWSGVGVVYVTGRRPSRLDGRVLGPRDRFLPKPVAPSALVRAVSGLARPPVHHAVVNRGRDAELIAAG
jgi:hypothetical protein